MFTGIITDIGRVTGISGKDGKRLVIHCHYPLKDLKIGNSIACDGACLTITDTGKTSEPGYNSWFSADVSRETLACTNIDYWKTGYEINLERALALGDELGGHMVSGHVDGLAHIIAIEPVDTSWKLTFSIPEPWKFHVAAKGSVVLNGVSLTVNKVQGNQAEINIIPHTLQKTNLGQSKPGDALHFEVDLIARYLGRLQEARK